MYPKLLLLTAFCLFSLLLPGQLLTLAADSQPATAPDRALPTNWRATGKVYDQYDRPVAGAQIRILAAPGPGTITGPDGSFTLPDVRPDTRLRITKAEHLETKVPARDLSWFFRSAQAGQTEISLPVLDVRFTVGPEGGTFRGPIDIDVPAGALFETVTIRAAVLPPGYRSLPEGAPHPLSFGSVHFEPAGLQFRRPIRIRQPGASALADHAAPALVQLVTTPTGAEGIPVPGAAVEVRGDDWYYSLTHFSEYRMIDANNMVQSYRPGYDAQDANMDGVVNEQDAERILKLENGPHDFTYTLSFRQTQSIAESRESIARDESSTTAGGGASAGVGGLEVGATMEDRVRRANELAEKFGYDRVRETVRTATFKLSDSEYITQCEMVFCRYDFRRFREYRKHQPAAAEVPAIRASHRAHRETGNEWSHLRVEGSTSIAIDRSLYGGQRLAVRENDQGELEVYVLRAEYTLRTLKGFGSGDCERYASQSGHRLRYGDYPRLGPDGAESYSLEYRGFRPITEPDEKHYEKECGSSYTGTITTRRSQLAFKELTATRERENTADRGVSAGLSVPLPGGVTLGGNASLNTSRTRAATAVQNYATNTSESDESTLEFTIRNEHEEHESDHELYRLYHVYEMRDWYYRHPTDPAISSSLKQRMREDLRTSRIRGRGTDGKLVLLQKDGDREYWYESGPPIEIVREAGFLLKRVGERPCGVEEPPLRDPRPTETTPGPDLPDDQSYRPRGTGRTTGHIATISVHNRSDQPLDIAGEWVYIPSHHRFQSYVGRIQGPIRVAPGAMVPVLVYGYCLDVRRPPVPAGEEMSLADWVPVGGPTTGGRSILPRPPRPIFSLVTIPAIVRSPAFERKLPAEDRVTVVWPAAEELLPAVVSDVPPQPSLESLAPQSGEPIGGVIDLDRMPELTAPLAVTIVRSVERGARNVQQNPAISTPFAADPDRELEALIQQTVWRVIASLTGQAYRKAEFAQTVYGQYEDNTGRPVTSLPPRGKEQLDAGVDDFWNAFSAVGMEAKVIQYEPTQTQDK